MKKKKNLDILIRNDMKKKIYTYIYIYVLLYSKSLLKVTIILASKKKMNEFYICVLTFSVIYSIIFPKYKILTS